MKKRILLVDGYNMIAFWQETRQLFKTNQLDEARETLLRKLNHYANFEHIDIVSVIFTEEDQTADSYIERAAAEMNTVQNLVEVATSDLNEQWAIFSQGALRVSARELEERVNTVKSDLDKMSAHIDLKTPKLRPWDDAQLGKLQDLLNEIEQRDI